MEKISFEQLGETLYHEQLPNGLHVYLLPKHGFQKTYATFTTKYGSIDNDFQPPNGERMHVPDGIAHFLEHKMFEQEEGDVFEEFSKNGASANAYTSFNRTTYLFSCTERLEQNLLTLIDFVQDPYFTDENVEKEKGIIGQEIRMYDDNPDWRVYFGLIEAMYREHPVRIDIAGTVDSIAQITKETLYRCYETFYHPNNMVLFVVGDVDEERIMQLIRDNQATKPFQDRAEIKRFYPQEHPGIHERSKKVPLSVSISKCLMGFKEERVGLVGDAFLKQEVATHIALEALLGQSSDLYQGLYNDGLIDDQFSFDYLLEDGFGFSLFGGDSKDPDTLISRIESALPQYVERGISDDTFERLRKKKIGEFLRNLNSPEFIANQFTRYRFNRADLYRLVPVLESMRPTDVNERLQHHFHSDRFATSIVYPMETDASAH